MKIFRSEIILLMVFLLFLYSCENNENGSVSNEYLVDYELKSTNTLVSIQTLLSVASIVYPELDPLIDELKYGVDIYIINYKTTFLGNEVVASGLLCLPETEEPVPILSFQNGTNTCQANAPTNNPQSTLLSLMSSLAGMGYIICIPDYIGFGKSEQFLHPYHHAESSNAAVVDMIRASRELIAKDDIMAQETDDVFLTGYSQGGWATLSAARKIDISYSSLFNLKAVACGAGAYNLTDFSEYLLNLDAYSTPFYLPYFIESRRQNGILTEDDSVYFKEPYATTIPNLFNGEYCNTELNAELPEEIDSLLTDNFINNFETSSDFASLREELDENSVKAWDISSPIRLFHSKGDNSVPYFLSEDMYAGLSAYGDVDLVLIDSLDHNEAIIKWGVDAFNWFNDLKSK